MSMAGSDVVAVLGATGQQGGAVVDALLDRGANVRALVRRPDSEKVRTLADRGVELVFADADEPESLAACFSGVGAFFFMTSPPGGMQNPDTDGETRQGVAIANAVGAARVPRVVFSSVAGAERNSGVPHFESKRRIEEHLDTIGLNTTLIRPVFFMDNLRFMGPKRENDEIVLRLPLPDGIPLQMIAVRDIGLVAAAALLGTAEIPGNAIEIAGDELTGSEMAAAFGQGVGLPARYEALPIEVLDGQTDTQLMFRWFAETAGFQADIPATKNIVPDAFTLPAWIASSAWSA